MDDVTTNFERAENNPHENDYLKQIEKKIVVRIIANRDRNDTLGTADSIQ